MKRLVNLVVIIFILILSTTSCSTQKTSKSVPVVASSQNANLAVNSSITDEKTAIEVQSPMTLSNSICTLNGQLAYLRLKMVSGKYHEDWNPGAFMGTLWEGNFIIELADEYGKTIAETDISKMFSELLTFKSFFNLEFDDFNNDGDLDFTIGQYGSSNGYYYRIFTLRKDGKIEQLPIKDRSDLFISNRTGNYSTKLNKINGTTFDIEYYDNSVPATFHDFYQWDGKQFVLINSQKMTREDAMTGSIQDKNNHYIYVKYGKSEDGLMEFTRTGTQINGYVEMASINQKNEVEIKKYPFNGTLVNNYISITFPGESWLNSTKRVTWIGNFYYQGFDISLPVDTSVDPNGFTMLTFNKGTIDNFNNDVSELKGRAQEWKREAEQANKQQGDTKIVKNHDNNTDLSGIQPAGITFDDQRQVEKLIKDYFGAIEKKDYATAWELTSQQQKNSYSKSDAINNHWGIESLKFISMKGYLPTATAVTEDVPPNTPTVWFIVTFDVKPSSNTAWGTGITSRYVDVVKDGDGKWEIDGLATGR